MTQQPFSTVPPNIRLLSAFNLCLDFRIYGPIAILYFVQITGSFALGLSIFSIAMLFSALFEVPTGIFSDLIGRKMTMVLGSLFSISAIVFYALGGSFWILAVGAALEGIASSLFSGNQEALLYDSLKEQGQEKDFSEYHGRTSAMFQWALGVSALISSFLGHHSFQILVWLSVIPQVIGFIITLQMREPQIRSQKMQTNIFSHLKESLSHFRKNKKLRTITLAKVLDYSIGESVHQFSPAFIATLWPTWAIGLARVISHISAALGFRFAGRAIRRFGEATVLIWANTFNFVLSIVTIGYPTILTPLLGGLCSFPFGLSMVSQGSLFQREFSDEQRATLGSLISFFRTLFFALFALIFGMYADFVGPQIALLTGAALLFSIVPLYRSLLIKKT